MLRFTKPLVSLTLENLRPRWGGRLTAKLFQPIATHDFLNVRTYVKCNGEPGIHFLGEWLSNRLAVRLGPPIFSLPYHYGKIDCRLEPDQPILQGRVTDAKTGTQLEYQGLLPTTSRQHFEAGTVTDRLMERYTAFNAATGRKKFFRVWPPP